MMSRSEMIPTMEPLESTTTSAPMPRRVKSTEISCNVRSSDVVATSRPFLAKIRATVILHPPLSVISGLKVSPLINAWAAILFLSRGKEAGRRAFRLKAKVALPRPRPRARLRAPSGDAVTNCRKALLERRPGPAYGRFDAVRARRDRRGRQRGSPNRHEAVFRHIIAPDELAQIRRRFGAGRAWRRSGAVDALSGRGRNRGRVRDQGRR